MRCGIIQNIEEYQQIVKSLQDNIPQTISIMIIDDEGNLLKNYISKDFENRVDPAELEYFAKIIGLRFKIVGFDKILHGLEVTINVFRDNCIFVTSVSSKFIIAIMTEKVDVEKTRHIISKIKSESVNHKAVENK